MLARPKLYLRSYPMPDDMRAHAAGVEEDGWDGMLFNDTQNLGMDVFGSLYLAASATSHLELGTAVTNLVTRHPAVMASAFATLHHVSGGRVHIGVGRGDTALELVGIKPPSVSRFATLLEHLQSYLRGEVVDVEGFQSRITWLPLGGESKVPVDVFGSGPRVIDAGARLGDRITVAVGAERERVRWAVSTARKAREEMASLDPDALDIGAFVVVGAGTDRRSLDELVRGNASISAHFQRDVASSLSRQDARVVEEVTSRHGARGPGRGPARGLPEPLPHHRRPGTLRRKALRTGRPRPLPPGHRRRFPRHRRNGKGTLGSPGGKRGAARGEVNRMIQRAKPGGVR